MTARAIDDWMPLHCAASRENPAVVRALLDTGANGAARRERGETPFDLAEKNDDLRGTAAYWRLNDARFK